MIEKIKAGRTENEHCVAALHHLKNGGLSTVKEVVADQIDRGMPQVFTDSRLILALCELAEDGLNLRRNLGLKP